MSTAMRVAPGPGQESVWDYPRPPRLERFSGHVQIVLGGVTIADTHGAYRVLETSHPPVYYLPPGNIRLDALIPVSGTSFCEWKGLARYFDVVGGSKQARRAAWHYPDPVPDFAPIAGYVAFYAEPMDSCYVNGERATPQPGGFYGGWVTTNIVGPFKSIPGRAGR